MSLLMFTVRHCIGCLCGPAADNPSPFPPRKKAVRFWKMVSSVSASTVALREGQTDRRSANICASERSSLQSRRLRVVYYFKSACKCCMIALCVYICLYTELHTVPGTPV